VAVIGPQAISRSGLLSDYAADQQCFGGDDHCIGTIAEGIAAANAGGSTVSAQGVEVNSKKTDGIEEALNIAAGADVIVLALGNDKSIEHEGQDRIDTALPGLQLSFAKQVLALNRTTVLVLTNGGALAIDELIERPSAGPVRPGGPKPGYAIVDAFNPAVQGGRAIGASLFGLENRWGKLPITMYPHSYIKEQSMVNYDMSIAPGRTYRYYQGKPLFHFGFGLSLTQFSLSDCAYSAALPGHHMLACKLANVGLLEGDEVVQIYHVAQDIGQVDHPLPKRSLVDFERFRLPAGTSINITFRIPMDAFKVVNKDGARLLYPGKHRLVVSRGDIEDETSMDVVIPSIGVYFV